MITPIDTLLINDHTEQSRSKLMKSTIIMGSGKRERIENTIMNGVIRRVHSVMLNNIRSEMAIARLYNTFKGEK